MGHLGLDPINVQIKTRNITHIYFSSMIICHKLIDPSTCVRNIQGIPPLPMLEYLVIHSSIVSNVYMDDIVNMKG